MSLVGTLNPLLRMAVWNGDCEAVQKQLDRGADINYIGLDGCTPLWSAVQRDQLACIKLLLSRKAMVGIAEKQCGWTELFSAVHRNRVAIMEVLLDAGANINHRDADGFSPLLCAAYYDRPKAAELLLKRGADLNVRNRGADLDVRNTLRTRLLNSSALEVAEFLQHWEIARLIRSAKDITWSEDMHKHFAASFKASVIALWILHQTCCSSAGQLTPCHADAKNRFWKLPRPLLFRILSFAQPVTRLVQQSSDSN